ncbi:MAG: Holliday junction branch migration protein RuvA [Micrococcales bacterium]
MVIASLSGQVLAKTNGTLVIDVSGVGYSVATTRQVLATCEVGTQLTVHTALIVREDAFLLFGFESAEQLALFDLLRSVTGVGPKLALAILSALSNEQIANAVVTENSDAFQSVSGVGAKTAKLISVTLAGKLKPMATSTNSDEATILETLKGLGWSEKQAAAAVREALAANPGAELSVIIRAALQTLGRS